MPRGSHLTPAHQAAAGRRNIKPRTPGASAVARSEATQESLDEATLRLQQAKADTEQLDAQKREIELSALRRGLIPAAEAQDELEATHLRWVAELDQLPHSAVADLPASVPASVREIVRQTIEAQCMAARQRIADG